MAFAAGLLLLLAAMGVATLNRRDQDAGLHEAVQYDDFAFSVESWSELDALPGAAAGDGGSYYVVDLQVENRARRVDYRFEDRIVLLRDISEDVWRVDPEAQAALDRSRGGPGRCALPLHPGEKAVRTLVFRAPPLLEDPQIQIAGGGLGLFALLDDVFWGRKRIHLR